MRNKTKIPNLTSKEATILGILLLQPGQEMYGLELVENSGGLLKRGTIYVTLQRMEDKRLVESRQEPRAKPEAGIPRRLYVVTGLGAAALSEYGNDHRKISELIALGASIH